MVAQEVADVVVVKWVGGRMRVMKRKWEASKVAETGNEKEVGSKVRWPRQVMKRKWEAK
jgi:hypothetical protein